jgi:hypothetical protein
MRRGTPMIGFATAPTDVDWFVLPTQPATPNVRALVEVIPLPMVAIQLEVRGELRVD